MKQTERRTHVKKHRKHNEVPDLQTQFEDLLHCVWRCEADWRFFDRIARG